MQIIDPSAVIIEDELSSLSIYQRISYCAGVCYQREPRKTEEEAQAFCRRMVEIGHMSTLEMATINLASTNIYDWPMSKYIDIGTNSPGSNEIILSGSVRAWLEAEGEYGSRAWNLLAEQYPVFFTQSDQPDGTVWTAGEAEIPMRQRRVAVRFIVNRAISHELVRHRPCSFLQESQRYCRYEDEVVFIRPEWATGDETAMSMVEAVWRDSVNRSAESYKALLKEGMKPQQARSVLPNSTKTELICYASLPQWAHIFQMRCSLAADPEMIRVMIPLREEFMQQYPEAFAGGDE